MPKGLWVVATPIGNLLDLSPRAHQALIEASAILCEDTRQGAKLAAFLEIQAPHLLRLDAHAPSHRLKTLVNRMVEGESLALISDAGTPGVSDPGSELIGLAREQGVQVTPIPGPSAVTALLSASGFSETAFTFRGFFPRASGSQEREIRLVESSRASRVFVWFESPHRIFSTLETLSSRHPGADTIVAKELTKIHEKFFSGSLLEVSRQIESEIASEGERGEWSFAVKFPKVEESSEWVKTLQCLIDAQVSASEAAKRVSQHFGVAKNVAYERALEISGKKNR